MGEFAKRVERMTFNKWKSQRDEIEFRCSNCLNLFSFKYQEIFLNNSEDIEIVPEPSCPRCGSVKDLYFSDYGQEKIEGMLFRGKIKEK